MFLPFFVDGLDTMQLRRDPCGLACVFFAYVLVAYGDYVVITFSIAISDTLWAAFHSVIFNTLIFLSVVSHLRAMLSNPGIVPVPHHAVDVNELRNSNLANGYTVCMKCEIVRPPRAHHCRICKRCIRKMDHHCPWVNNCVGEYNQRYFIQFIFYIFLSCVYGAVVMVHYWIRISVSSDANARSEVILIHTIIFCIECALFLLFTMAMMCDQLNGIFEDATLIEQKQLKTVNGNFGSSPVDTERQSRRKSRCELLQDVFGPGSRLLWICPFDVQFRSRKSVVTVEV